MLVCTGIAWALHAGTGVPFDRGLVYAQAHGLTAWFILDAVHHRIWPEDQRGAHGFLSWRTLATLVPALVLSFVVGTLIGDVYSGHTTLNTSFSRWAPSLLFNSVLLIGVAGLFYAQAVRNQRRLALEGLQRHAAQTQLQMLQTQLEPHMLFNTLANLRVLIGVSPPDAQHMLDQLNDYLRASLASSQTPTHPLSHEVQRLKDYLGLMSWRMGDRLRCEFDIAPHLMGVAVPSMILQPLVENAIRHGLEPCTKGGTLTISAHLHGGEMQLSVADDGAGCPEGFQPPDTPAVLPRVDSEPAAARHAGGFGLRATRERLALAHGPQARMSVQATHPGTRVTLTWPMPGPQAGSTP